MALQLDHLMAFLVVMHTLLWFGGTAGLVPQQQGENTHKEFVNKFSDGDGLNTTRVDDQSGTFEQLSLGLKSIPVIGFIYDVLSTPYGLLLGTGLPEVFKLLLSGLLGVFEFTVTAGYLRGVSS